MTLPDDSPMENAGSAVGIAPIPVALVALNFWMQMSRAALSVNPFLAPWLR